MFFYKKSRNNNGTLIIDATCAPQNISYPQDTNLLNEARKATENIIDDVCYEYNEVRPIVRGKAKSPVEFGAKLDLSIDNKGNARIEKLSFDAYNESEVLQKETLSIYKIALFCLSKL